MLSVKRDYYRERITMMISIFNKKNRNGIEILAICIKDLLNHRYALAFTLFALGCNLVIFSFFVDLEYYYYGIHIFDHTTFKEIFNFSFWDHIGHVLLGFFTLFTMNSIISFFQMSIAYTFIENLSHRSVHIKKILLLFRTHFIVIMQLSLIKTLGALLIILNAFAVIEHIKKMRHFIAGNFEENHDEYSHPESMIMIPIIVEKKISIINALKESKEVLIKTFGRSFKPQFSFLGFKILYTIMTLLFIGSFLKFILNLHIFTTLIICSIILITFASIFENVKIFFESNVYNYCKKSPLRSFSEQELVKLFTPQLGE